MNSTRQVVLVSGGSRGLGRALVANLLKSGYVVATFSQSRSPFIKECQQNDPQGKSFWWEALDITDCERVKQFTLAAARRYGQIDVLVGNVGMAVSGPLALMRASDIQRMVAVNLEGAIHLSQACARVMLVNRFGIIINISSIVGLRGHIGLSVYSATKAAIDGMTRSLARELGPRGIRVNSIAPGYVDTDMSGALTQEQREQILRRTPLRQFARIEDVIGAVRFFMSAEARFVTGQTLVVDGGYTC